MEILHALGRTIPFAFASGLNLYATVAVLGICARYDLVALPNQFEAFAHPAVIIGALVLYLVEFVADKVPWVDSIWDMAHTIVRPVGGALVAVNAMGAQSPGLDALAALLGASVALTTHLTKAGARAAANTTPEPVSNWALSVAEDILAIGLTYVAMQHPVLALTVAVILLAVIVVFATFLIRAVRRRFTARRAAA